MIAAAMSRDIHAQPALLEHGWRSWQQQANHLTPRLGSRSNVVLVGRGSSAHACTFGSYLFAACGGPHPIEFRSWVSSDPRIEAANEATRWDEAVVLAYSAARDSTEVSTAARWLRGRGAHVIGVTTSPDPDSHLERAAHELFQLHVGPDEAVPASKTFCAQLFGTAALSGLSLDNAAVESAAAMRAILRSNVAERLVDFLRGARQIVWVARGPAVAAALDAALKVQQAAGRLSVGYSSPELLYGPIRAVTPEDRVVLLSDRGEVVDSLAAVAVSLVAKRIPFAVVGPADAEEGGRLEVSIPVPMPRQRWARTPILALVSQLAALGLARRGEIETVVPAQSHELPASDSSNLANDA
jgi:glutamine---fructose-6-phosphate transaminase (isomerizing)